MTNVTHKFLCVYLFITLYMFRAHSAHHQGDKLHQYNLWQQSFYVGGLVVYRLEVAVYFQPAHNLATNIEWLLPEFVLIQFVSSARNMERVINKYIERNLCVTLVIYQESLHDARSTKCKITKPIVTFCNFAKAHKTNGDFKHCHDISVDFEGQGEGKCRF